MTAKPSSQRYIKLTSAKHQCEGCDQIEYDDSITDSVEPGTFNNAVQDTAIKWGDRMLGPIEPGVIHVHVKHLMLPPGFNQDLSKSQIPESTNIYIHKSSSRSIVPYGRSRVWLWRYDSPFTDTQLSVISNSSDLTLDGDSMIQSSVFSFLPNKVYIVPCYRPNPSLSLVAKKEERYRDVNWTQFGMFILLLLFSAVLYVSAKSGAVSFFTGNP